MEATSLRNSLSPQAYQSAKAEKLLYEARKRREYKQKFLPDPHDTQAEVLADAVRFNIVDCGRRWGKTELGLYVAAEAMLEGQPIGWFAPTYKILADAWRRAKILLRPVMVSKNETEKRIELRGGGTLEAWSLDSGNDVARGRKYQRAVIDEAARYAKLEDAWTYAIRPSLTDYEGDAWFFSTPKGHNYFWRLYVLGQDDEHQQYRSWQMPSATNPYLPHREIEEARNELPDRVFRQEYLADFIENEGIVFRNIGEHLNAPETPHPKEHKGHRIVGGVDWGKHQDFTVFSLACAGCQEELVLYRSNNLDYAFQRQRLAAFADRWKPADIQIELNAMGEPLFEELQRAGLNVSGFTTTSTSKQPLIENLVLAFEQEGWQFLDDPIGAAELQAFERKVNPNTNRASYGAPSGMHDDTVIARALMMHAAASARAVWAF